MTTCRHPASGSGWKRSPAINRFVVGVGSSRWCARRIGLGTPSQRENGRLASSSHVTRSCSTRLALRTRTGKPTACTVRCTQGMHNGSALVLTSKEFWPLATVACRALTGYATAPLRYSTLGPMIGTKLTVACGRWNISARATTDEGCLARLLGDPEEIKLRLSRAH